MVTWLVATEMRWGGGSEAGLQQGPWCDLSHALACAWVFTHQEPSPQAELSAELQAVQVCAIECSRRPAVLNPFPMWLSWGCHVVWGCE